MGAFAIRRYSIAATALVHDYVAVSPPFATARIVLRPLLTEVAAALITDRDLAAAMLGAELPPGWPQAGFLDVISARAESSRGGDHFGVWVIVDRVEETVVGDVGFKRPPDAAGVVEIGYSVLVDWRGRGYAAEAAAALVDWALGRPNVRAVVASCDHGNAPSIRTLERAGFQRTGEASGEIQWRYAPASSAAE